MFKKTLPTNKLIHKMKKWIKSDNLCYRKVRRAITLLGNRAKIEYNLGAHTILDENNISYRYKENREVTP